MQVSAVIEHADSSFGVGLSPPALIHHFKCVIYQDTYHANDVSDWQKKYGEAYASIKYYGPHSFLKEQEARNKGL